VIIPRAPGIIIDVAALQAARKGSQEQVQGQGFPDHNLPGQIAATFANVIPQDAKFDPATGQPIIQQRPTAKFDIHTGQPIVEQPTAKFDTQTGQPVVRRPVSYDPQTGQPIYGDTVAAVSSGFAPQALQGQAAGTTLF
jgi:hypothetical protein